MKLGIHLLAAAGLVCGLFAAPATTGELGVELRSFAGRYDGDTATQIEAVETLTAAGAAGILIAPSDPSALAGAVGKARAAGLLVIALDTPFDPADTVDATFATDNFRAGGYRASGWE